MFKGKDPNKIPLIGKLIKKCRILREIYDRLAALEEKIDKLTEKKPRKKKTIKIKPERMDDKL